MIRRILKGTAKVLLALVALVALLLVALYFRGSARLQKVYEPAIVDLAVPLPTDDAALAQGRHWAESHCASCHGDDLGGQVMIDDPSFAVVHASNLTSGKGGAASRLDARGWVRAVRHGLDPLGRPLVVMPAEHFRYLSDADLAAIVGYLEQMPPIDRETPAPQMKPLARTLLGAGMLGGILPAELFDHAEKLPPAPVPGVTEEYGGYLVTTGGCTTCHGADLGGGRTPGPDGVPTPNITPAGPVGTWSDAMFLQMVKTRDSEHMPWKYIRRLTDDELLAIRRYLASVPPVAPKAG